VLTGTRPLSRTLVAGSSGATTLYATADEKPRPIGSASVTTTVAPGTEPEKTVLAPPGQSGASGDTLLYEFQVVNIGTNDASYRLSLSGTRDIGLTMPVSLLLDDCDGFWDPTVLRGKAAAP